MKGRVKVYYYPNQWNQYQNPHGYRFEENNEQEEQEWEIEKKFMDDMRNMMYQHFLIQKQLLEKVHHIDRRLIELEAKLCKG